MDTLLVFQIDPAAKAALERRGIEVLSGFSGNVQTAARSYLGRFMTGAFDEAEPLAS